MPARLLKRGGIGFLLGAAIGAVFIWQSGLPDGGAGALPAQLLLSGVYGACCMGGTVLYEIESWSLMKSTMLHWLISALLYVPIALLLQWVDSPGALLLTEGIMLAAFLLIWLIMYLHYKAKVRALNGRISKWNKAIR